MNIFSSSSLLVPQAAEPRSSSPPVAARRACTNVAASRGSEPPRREPQMSPSSRRRGVGLDRAVRERFTIVRVGSEEARRSRMVACIVSNPRSECVTSGWYELQPDLAIASSRWPPRRRRTRLPSSKFFCASRGAVRRAGRRHLLAVERGFLDDVHGHATVLGLVRGLDLAAHELDDELHAPSGAAARRATPSAWQ